MKNKITALLMAAALSLSLIGPALALKPAPGGETVKNPNGGLTIENPNTTPGSNQGGSDYTPTTPSDPSYSITDAKGDTEEGAWTSDKTSAKKDETVVITVTPKDGYDVANVTVKDASGNEVTVTDLGDGKYSYVMPASRVTVSVTFAPKAIVNPFTDVSESDIYYDAVMWAVKNKITTGLTATTFGPRKDATRAQTVTYLWRLAGEPEPATTEHSFTDVDPDAYYYKAMLWALEKGITTGKTSTTFDPNGVVDRAQFVTFLYRYAGKPEANAENPFTDVTNPDAYYYDAVLWALENEITTGTTATTFAPTNDCLRYQIVLFLYRYSVK